MSAAERISWQSEHPVLLWCAHPCDDIWDALDVDSTKPVNDNGVRLVALGAAEGAEDEKPMSAPTAHQPKPAPEWVKLRLQRTPSSEPSPSRASQWGGCEYLERVVERRVRVRGRRCFPEAQPRTSTGRGQPPTKKIEYDDLYRATRVKYEYAEGDDTWNSPFDAELDGNPNNDDERRAQPSPHVAFQRRILEQSFQYDWLGNNEKTSDDANGFYDRSLGDIQNDGQKPYQLTAAASASGASDSDDPSFPGVSSNQTGSLQTKYDPAGNMVGMSLSRNGTCLGGAAGECSQRFVYNWDEVGRMVRARRWDGNPGSVDDPVPSGTPAADLRNTYDASDQRVVKEAVDAGGNKSYTLYIFASLELRRTQYGAGYGTDGSSDDFEVSIDTVVPYLMANGVRLARLVHHADGVPTEAIANGGGPGEVNASTSQLHVFFELGDHLGSTSVVLDKATGELVERATFQAYGGAESDYRPDRWKSFREDYRFTGKEEDVEVGLQYFGKRFLNPLLGRWVSADPLAVHAPGEADLNLYAYVLGAVLKNVDPLGLEDVDPEHQKAQDAYKAAQADRAEAVAAENSYLGELQDSYLETLGKGDQAASEAAYKKVHEQQGEMAESAAKWEARSAQFERMIDLTRDVQFNDGVISSLRLYAEKYAASRMMKEINAEVEAARQTGIFSVPLAAKWSVAPPTSHRQRMGELGVAGTGNLVVGGYMMRRGGSTPPPGEAPGPAVGQAGRGGDRPTVRTSNRSAVSEERAAHGSPRSVPKHPDLHKPGPVEKAKEDGKILQDGVRSPPKWIRDQAL